MLTCGIMAYGHNLSFHNSDLQAVEKAVFNGGTHSRNNDVRLIERLLFGWKHF